MHSDRMKVIKVLVVAPKKMLKSAQPGASEQALMRVMGGVNATVADKCLPGAHQGRSPRLFDIAIVFECNGDSNSIAKDLRAWSEYRLPVAAWTITKQQPVADAMRAIATKQGIRILEELMPTTEKPQVVEPTPTPTPLTIVESKTIDGFKLVRIEGRDEPRILDTDLAERAGKAQPRDVRGTIKDHRAELEEFGPLEVCVLPAQTQGGRPGTAFYLNEAQAYHLVALLKTPKAAELRVAMTKVFVAWGRGELPGKAPSSLSERMLALLAQETEKEIKAAEERGAKALEDRVAPVAETATQAKAAADAALADLNEIKARSENAERLAADEEQKREDAMKAAKAEREAEMAKLKAEQDAKVGDVRKIAEEAKSLIDGAWNRPPNGTRLRYPTPDQTSIQYPKQTRREVLNAKERADARRIIRDAAVLVVCQVPGIKSMSLQMRCAFHIWAMSLLRTRANHGMALRDVPTPFTWRSANEDINSAIDHMLVNKFQPPASYMADAKSSLKNRSTVAILTKIGAAA